MKGHSSVEAKLAPQSFIGPQRLDNHFDEVLHRIALEVSERGLGVDRLVLDVGSNIV